MKPKKKKQIAVCFKFKSANLIEFIAPPEIANEFREYGQFLDEETHLINSPGKYMLAVDPRYDYDEVLGYIENYDAQFDGKISSDVINFLDQIELPESKP